VPPPTFGDTWTYDGVAWTQRAVVGPPPRRGHAMAFDALRQVVVMFGGVGGSSTMLDDTWEWDGISWTQRVTPQAPQPRTLHAMGFDLARAVVVLHGGGDGATTFSDTWTWNGTAWAALATSAAPSPRLGAVLVFDPVRQLPFLVGGFECNAAATCFDRLDSHWLVQPFVAPQTADVGSGCSATVAPRLATSTPYLGNSDFAYEVLGTAPNAPCFVGFASALQAQPLGPCTLYLQGGAFALLGAVANGFGVARVPLALPQQPALAGFDLVAQAIVLAQPGALLGFDLTAARTIRLGH
jgi:hypothetical protein